MKRLNIFTAVLGLAVIPWAPLFAVEVNQPPILSDTVSPQDASRDQTAFAPAIDDLPLMPGLAPVDEENTLFVVPSQGRIATSTVQGSVDVDDIYVFYRRSLPQLGWKKIDARTFERGNERLRIVAQADGKVTTVTFSVTPR